MTAGMSLAASASSHEDDGDSAKARRTSVVPQEPQLASQVVADTTADATNPDVTSAKPTRPEGASYNPPDQLPSTSLKGGRAGPSDELSEVPMDETTLTTQPTWTPQDDESSGEVHEVAESHEEAVGKDVKGGQVEPGRDADA